MLGDSGVLGHTEGDTSCPSSPHAVGPRSELTPPQVGMQGPQEPLPSLPPLPVPPRPLPSPPDARTFPRRGGQCERVSPPLGYLRRPPQRPALCLWEVGKAPAACREPSGWGFPRGMRTLCETELKEFHSETGRKEWRKQPWETLDGKAAQAGQGAGFAVGRPGFSSVTLGL